VALMLLEVLLLLTISIAGTRVNTVTNGVMALGFYGIAFIGGFVDQAGSLGGVQSATAVGERRAL
jgi:hypothetical protein